MSDTRLRKLERDAAAGDPEARIQLIRERVRAGVITKEQLELGAWLMDDAAWEVHDWWTGSDHIAGICPCPECTLNTVGKGIATWVSRLAEWEDEALIRVALAAAKLANHHWADREIDHADMCGKLACNLGPPEAIIQATEHYLIDPTEENKKLCAKLSVDMGVDPRYACELGLLVHWPPTDIHEVDPMHKWARANLVIQDAIGFTCEREFFDAVTEEVVPWVLGDDDPIKAIVEKRQE